MDYKAPIEGILFVRGEEGVKISELSDLFEISVEQVSGEINELINKYQDNSYGICIEKYGDCYKFVTKKEYNEYIEKLVEIDNNNILTEASLETLAVIVYNQPVTRIKVDEIRGVNSAHMIRKLINCGLVKVIGKSDLPGKPNLYTVTEQFLDHFGLENLNQLPSLTEVTPIDETDIDLFQSRFKEIEKLEIE